LSNLTLEPDFAEHPKVFELSDAAFRAHVRGMCWCAKYETDGYVTARIATQLAQGELLEELVRWRLWERDGEDGSVRIRDFLEYNPSREELARERARKKRGVRAGKVPERDAEKARANHETHTSEEKKNLSVTDQIPDPEGSPDNSRSGRARRWRRVPSEWRPTEKHIVLAVSLGVDLAIELEKFRDHEFRDPKSDADAAFRTWLRNAKRFSPRGLELSRTRNSGTELLERVQRMTEEKRALGNGGT